MRRAAVVLVVAALSSGFGLPADAAPTCFGKPVTLTVDERPFRGTAGNDVILGTPGNDQIDGTSGNDRICGLGGDDEIEGGRGDDKIDGGPGVDLLVGDVDADLGSTGQGDDLLLGGTGVSSVIFDEVLIGDNRSIDGHGAGAGNDRLDGGTDGAIIIGDSVGQTAEGGGSDVITRSRLAIGDSAATDSVVGSGDDRIEVLDGGAVGDSSSGLNANVSGSGGDDVIVGSNEANELIGDHSIGSGSATGSGRDRISGRDGADEVFGDCRSISTNASVLGSGSDDRLSGGPGADSIEAGPGDDVLDGGANVDVCDGEGGLDSFERCETSLQ